MLGFRLAAAFYWRQYARNTPEVYANTLLGPYLDVCVIAARRFALAVPRARNQIRSHQTLRNAAKE
jgi:hypothetical protein